MWDLRRYRGLWLLLASPVVAAVAVPAEEEADEDEEEADFRRAEDEEDMGSPFLRGAAAEATTARASMSRVRPGWSHSCPLDAYDRRKVPHPSNIKHPRLSLLSLFSLSYSSLLSCTAHPHSFFHGVARPVPTKSTSKEQTEQCRQLRTQASSFKKQPDPRDLRTYKYRPFAEQPNRPNRNTMPTTHIPKYPVVDPDPSLGRAVGNFNFTDYRCDLQPCPGATACG